MRVRVFTDCLNGGVVGVFDSKTKMHFPSSFPPCHVVVAAAAVIRLVAKVITRDGRTEGRRGGRTDGRTTAKVGAAAAANGPFLTEKEGKEAMRGRRLLMKGWVGRERNEEMSGM